MTDDQLWQWLFEDELPPARTLEQLKALKDYEYYDYVASKPDGIKHKITRYVTVGKCPRFDGDDYV